MWGGDRVVVEENITYAVMVWKLRAETSNVLRTSN